MGAIETEVVQEEEDLRITVEDQVATFMVAAAEEEGTAGHQWEWVVEAAAHHLKAAVEEGNAVQVLIDGKGMVTVIVIGTVIDLEVIGVAVDLMMIDAAVTDMMIDVVVEEIMVAADRNGIKEVPCSQRKDHVLRNNLIMIN